MIDQIKQTNRGQFNVEGSLQVRTTKPLKPSMERVAQATPRAVLEKLATIQMLDVCLPTTDGRWLIMSRYTQPEPEQTLLLHQLHLSLPSQPPPRIKPAETVTNCPVQLKM